MLRSYVRLQQDVSLSQCRFRAVSTHAYAGAAGRKKGRPNADENAVERPTTTCEQRTVEHEKNDGAPVSNKQAVLSNTRADNMAARFSKTALWLLRPKALSPKIVTTSRVHTSLRLFSHTCAYLQTKKKPEHYDLSSYREHAMKKGLDQTSNVYKGKLYEYTVIEVLKPYGFELTSVGQTGDRGKDFEGIWKLHKHTKNQPNLVRVIGQCKASKVGPRMVRELDGTASGARDVLRFLVSEHTSSKGTTAAIQASSNPMAFAQVTMEGEVPQFFWNKAAVEAGLGGLGTTLKYKGSSATPESHSGSRGGTPTGTIRLTWLGKLWRPRIRKAVQAASLRRKFRTPKVTRQIGQMLKPIMSEERAVEA